MKSKESYKVKTYGRVVGITRQVLINDDLDAFTRIPAMYGNSIAQLECDVVWGIITGQPCHGRRQHCSMPRTRIWPVPARHWQSMRWGPPARRWRKQTGLDKKTVLNIRPPS